MSNDTRKDILGAPEDFFIPVRTGNLVTPQEALDCAKRFTTRNERRAEIVKQLHEEDMLGLECAETVELEKLAVEDAKDGWRLAEWVVLFGVRPESAP